MESQPAKPTAPRDGARATPEALERLEAEITELWGHLTAATYRFLMLVAEFDRSEAYARHGLPSTAHWLNWQCGIGMTAARTKVRVARALEQLPEVSAGFARGEFSYSKVRAIAASRLLRTNRCSRTSRATARPHTWRSSCASTAGRSGATQSGMRNRST
jgi:hypothetical protein